MNTRVCKDCGWEFPATYKPIKCKYCGGVLGSGYCLSCHEWTDHIVDNGLCTKCNAERHGRYVLKSRRATRDMYTRQYNDWLDRIRRVSSIVTLTDEQWLNACAYFNGCAYCDNEYVSTRSMFIPYKNGGRYCAWNILPACDKCEASRKGTENPFAIYDLERLKNICGYLNTRILEYTN